MTRHIQSFSLLTAFLLLSPFAIAQSKPAPAKPPAKSSDGTVAVSAEKFKEEVPPSLIKWQTSYADALAQAKTSKKPIMVDFSSANCGWCLVKEKYIDADPALAKIVNENFIPVKGAKDLGPVKAAFKPTGTPHTLFLSHDGEKLLVRIAGYSRPANFLDYLHDALQLQQAYLQNPDLIDPYKAAIALDHTQTAQTVALLDTIIQANPKMTSAYGSRAYRLFALGKPDAAIQDYLKYKELAPTDSQPVQYLAMVYMGTGKFLLAAKEFQHARKLAPRASFFLSLQEAVALARAGKKKESQEILKLLEKMPRDDAQGYGYPQAAISAIARNDTAKLDEYATKLFQNDKSICYWAMGNLQAIQGDKPKAIASLQKAVNTKFPHIFASQLAVIDLKSLGAAPLPAPAPKPKPAPKTPATTQPDAASATAPTP